MTDTERTSIADEVDEIPGPRPGSEGPPPRPGWFERLVPFVITAVILLIDQASKRFVETNIPLYTSWAPFPSIQNIFQFTHTANTGAVFGLFQGTSLFFAALAVIVAAAIVYFTVTLPGGHWALRVALGLQLGGALGNLIDRLRIGHVTDFIDIGPWYIFNVADMAIVGGTILFAFIMLRESRENGEGNATAPAPRHDSSPPTVD